MVVKVIESEHLDLGNIEEKKAGSIVYAWDISCSYLGKIDMTAFSLCCRKLDREKVHDITFQGIKESAKIRKIIDRELRSAKYEIEDSSPKLVEMSVEEMRRFEAWKKKASLVKETLKSSAPVVTITGSNQGQDPSQQPFQMRSESEAPSNFVEILDTSGQEIVPGSLWIYDGSLCTSEFANLVVRSVSKKGISFKEPMKLPLYHKKHFGPGGAFQRFKK